MDNSLRHRFRDVELFASMIVIVKHNPKAQLDREVIKALYMLSKPVSKVKIVYLMKGMSNHCWKEN